MTLRPPTAAVPAIVNVAVSRVGDMNATSVTVIPAPALTVAPATNPVPSIVTAALVPLLP